MIKWQNEDTFSNTFDSRPTGPKKSIEYDKEESRSSTPYDESYKRVKTYESTRTDTRTSHRTTPVEDTPEKEYSELATAVKNTLKALRVESTEKASKGYENNMPIVDRCIVPTEGEIPVRQYDIARLHTPFSKRAFGRLQVTNKRVIFRAAGKSPLGDLVTESEFSLEEIGGIEIVKDYFFSFVLFLITLLLELVVDMASGAIIMFSQSKVLCVIMAILSLAGIVASFIYLKKNHLVRAILYRILCMSISGIVCGSMLYSSYSSLLLAQYPFAAILICIVCILCIYETFESAFTEDLRISVKIKSGGEAVLVGRKLGFSTFQGHYKDKTGFMFVRSWTHTAIAIRELGALIDDVKRFGDAGIAKWKI